MTTKGGTFIPGDRIVWNEKNVGFFNEGFRKE